MSRIQRVARPVFVGAAISALMLAVGVLPTAARSVDTTRLNPPPSSIYACHGSTGGAATCHFTREYVVDPFPTGIICGSGPSTFEAWDGGETIHEEWTLYYNGNGDLYRRIGHETFVGATFSNPGTGASIRYSQASTYTRDYTTPGQPVPFTERTSGNAAIFVVPGRGAIVVNAGWTLWAWDPGINDLSFISSAGPQAFIKAFVYGDGTALQPICDALAP